MGNYDSRVQFEGGYIYMSTDRPFYFPGNTVYGKIYIRTEKPMQAKDITLRVWGTEKASYYYTQRVGENTERRQMVHNKTLYEFQGVCFTFQGPLNPGDYTVPFEFSLPVGIPSSMMLDKSGGFGGSGQKAKVLHTVTATLQMHDNSILKFSKHLVIQEPPIPLVEPVILQKAQNLSACMSSNGQSLVTAQMNKNVFTQDEIIQALVTVDQTNAREKATHIQMQLMQKLQISSSNLDGFFSTQKSWSTCEAKVSQPVDIPPNSPPTQLKLEFNLGLLRFEVSPTKNVGLFGSQTVARSPEEMFMLSKIPPECHSIHICCEYFVEVRVSFIGSCSQPAVLVMPVSILPSPPPPSQFVEPEGYNPTELGYFKFELNAAGVAHIPRQAARVAHVNADGPVINVNQIEKDLSKGFAELQKPFVSQPQQQVVQAQVVQQQNGTYQNPQMVAQGQMVMQQQPVAPPNLQMQVGQPAGVAVGGGQVMMQATMPSMTVSAQASDKTAIVEGQFTETVSEQIKIQQPGLTMKMSHEVSESQPVSMAVASGATAGISMGVGVAGAGARGAGMAPGMMMQAPAAGQMSMGITAPMGLGGAGVGIAMEDNLSQSNSQMAIGANGLGMQMNLNASANISGFDQSSMDMEANPMAMMGKPGLMSIGGMQMETTSHTKTTHVSHTEEKSTSGFLVNHSEKKEFSADMKEGFGFD